MSGRQALTYVELDISTCANIYGTAPCTASIPTTGAIKCFNCVKTCQDRPNYVDQSVTLRFAKPTDYLPPDIEALPSIADISFTPAIVSLGTDLGQRATLEISFTDHRDSDTGPGFDKYLADRPYDPFALGTFFGKFRARQPFLRGRSLRWINGFVGQALADMEIRHFVVESFDGPDPTGKYVLTGTDILKLADGDRAQAPALSNGFLSTDISDSATSATLLPTGVGNDEYPASGLIAIGGNEVVSFTRAGDVLTIARAVVGSVASAHKAQDRCQLVLNYTGADAAYIIHDLLVNYAGTPDAYIPDADWLAETAAFLGNVYTANICEPTGVDVLVSELIEQAALAMWDDNIAQQIRMQVLRGVTTEANVFTPDNICGANADGSMGPTTLATKEQPDIRLSRVQTYFGQIDPTKPLTNLDNFRSTSLVIDDAAEADYGSSAIKTIMSRWIPGAGRSVADRLGAILLGRFRDPPRHVGFTVMRNAGTDVALGGGYRIEDAFVQDATGASAQIPVQVTKLNPGPATFMAEAEEMLFSAPPVVPGTHIIIFDANNFNINLRNSHDSIYPVAVSGNTVICIVNAGVVVGSVFPSLPAFDVGSWPAGVIIQVQIRGLVIGAGGAGGAGGAPLAAGSDGIAGGTAFYTRAAVTLDIGSGIVWGGGGGGGGGGGHFGSLGGAGGGGGGGAGQTGGAGGNGGGSGGGGVASDGSPGLQNVGGGGGPSAGISPGGGGGAGGGPGLAGSAGDPGGGGLGGGAGPAGGGGAAAGAAIDGISHVSLTGSGDIRGPQIN